MLPGVWRLRLPLPWPGVPHCNAWAVAAGDGVVLFDTGMHEPGSLAHLERALDQVNLRLEHVRLVVCTHAHSDHYGQAAPIVERAGCELWMHPNHAHMTRGRAGPRRRAGAAARGRAPERRSRGAPAPLRRSRARARATAWRRSSSPTATSSRASRSTPTSGPGSRTRRPGTRPRTSASTSPSRGLLISGDHLLGRVSLYYDYGWTPDPAGEFLPSLDKVDALDARLCLAGHGKPFTDVRAHVEANRALVGERIAAVRAALDDGPLTAFEVVPRVYGEQVTPMTANWWLSETLCYLRHLEVTGEVAREEGEPERWLQAA